MQLDEADEVILDIIGKESAVLNGLPIPESSGTNEALTVLEEAIPNTSVEENEQQGNFLSSPQPSVPTRKRKVGVRDEELVELKKKLFKIEIYKKSLEVFELESKLGLPQSEFTLNFNEFDFPYEHPVD